MEVENCSICQENMIENTNLLTTECNHKFHTTCYLKYIQHSNNFNCPLCRNAIIQNSSQQERPDDEYISILSPTSVCAYMIRSQTRTYYKKGKREPYFNWNKLIRVENCGLTLNQCEYVRYECFVFEEDCNELINEILINLNEYSCDSADENELKITIQSCAGDGLIDFNSSETNDFKLNNLNYLKALVTIIQLFEKYNYTEPYKLNDAIGYEHKCNLLTRSENDEIHNMIYKIS